MESFEFTNDTPAVDVASLWQDYLKSKSVELRNQLAEFYLPLVRLVAGRLAISLPSHVDRDDLLSSGFFGLLDAIDRYDIERKNKFETYAGIRIRGAMLDYLRAKDWLPVAIRQRIRRYEQAVYDLENRLGRPATDEELAEELSVWLRSSLWMTICGQIRRSQVSRDLLTAWSGRSSGRLWQQPLSACQKKKKR